MSNLQTEITLSTMESEYIALSTTCKDLLPIVDLVKAIGTVFGLPVGDSSNMHVRVHEDNVGTLTLGNLGPRRMTLRSNHYAIKYLCFCEQLQTRKIKLVKLASADQLGDIFTKGFSRVIFERLRRKLMGW